MLPVGRHRGQHRQRRGDDYRAVPLGDPNQNTSYVSLDGAKWQPAGPPAGGLPMAGCWIGLGANNPNSSHPVQAVFDQVTGFQPDRFVLLGP